MGSRKPASEAELPQQWVEVLDSIQESLAQTLEEVAQREQALASEGVNAAFTAESDHALQQSLARVGERMLLFRSCLDQAEESAAEAESALVAGEDALHQWLTVAESTRQNLAKG
jgi:hypothetical protein